MTEFDPGLYRRLVESSPEGVVLIDAQGTDHPVVYVNPAFESLTGYSSADLIGRNLRLLQADDRDQDGRHRLRDALSRGETCRVLLRNYRKDGSLFWNEMTAALRTLPAITATRANACASIRRLRRIV
jgi:PAS domain S-box-containing protein